MISNTEKQLQPWMVLVKGLILLSLVNILFALPWTQHLGKYTLYNWLVPGRPRFYRTVNADSLLATHIISQPKEPNEFRVLMIGDSSVWGVLLNYPETTTAQLTDAGLRTCTGDHVTAYDLGMGFKSLVKDFMILDLAARYEPDMIIWFVTLETFTHERQMEAPFVYQNLEYLPHLTSKYDIDLPLKRKIRSKSLWDKTLVGQRGALKDYLDVQLSALNWAAVAEETLDQEADPPSANLFDDVSFNGWNPSEMEENKLRYDIFYAILRSFNKIPILVVNEPIFIADGKYSDIRYNANYPRWAYDQYRDIMFSRSQEQGWMYLDIWNVVPAEHFSNSSFHRDEVGEIIVAERIIPWILEMSCANP